MNPLGTKRMSQFLIRMRLVLGGAMCGSFLGLFAGALSAVAYGAHVGNYSSALIVVLGGGAICCLPGALYGALVESPQGAVPDKIRRG